MKKITDSSEQVSTRDSLNLTFRSSFKKPVLSRRAASITQPPAERLRTKSDQTESSSTFKDNKNISHSLNTHKLELSLKGIYQLDPIPRLEKFFRETKANSKKFQLSHRSRTKNVKNVKNSNKRSRKSDSIFIETEAELIRDELSSIKSPQVWQELVKNFKMNPGSLMELIPVK
jgi:hypothetical protein